MTPRPGRPRRALVAAVLGGVPVAVLSFGALASPFASVTSAAAAPGSRVEVSLLDKCQVVSTGSVLASDVSPVAANVLKWPQCAGD